MKKKVRVTKSSGNVFADIGLPNAAEHSIKADIVLHIAARIKSKGLTQAKAASLLGLAQPDVSKLLRGHFAGYTYDRLFGYLNALGEKVCIEISEAKTQERRPARAGDGGLRKLYRAGTMYGKVTAERIGEWRPG